MSQHRRLLVDDAMRCSCGWSAPWPDPFQWNAVWERHINERALTPGAPAGAVTMGSLMERSAPVVPQPAPAACHQETTDQRLRDDNYRPLVRPIRARCSCGWTGGQVNGFNEAHVAWLEHAVWAHEEAERGKR